MGNLLDWRWVEQLTRLFELCNVTSAETVVVLTDVHTDDQLRETCHLALQRLSPEVVSVILPDTGPNQLDTDVLSIPAVQAAVQEADFVADCTRSGIAASHLLPSVLNQGTRILTLDQFSPAELFAPHSALRTRIEAGIGLLEDARRVCLTTGLDVAPSPTELSVPLETAQVCGTWGFSSEPSSVARWPGGSVYVNVPSLVDGSAADSAADAPAPSSLAAGQLTLSPGDINLAARSYIRSAVTLLIEDGVVVEITGTGDDVSIINAQLDALLSKDPEGSTLKTLGWGMLLPARVPHFPNQHASHSLLLPEDFPIDPQVVHLAGVCFVSFGDSFQDLRTLSSSVLLALRSATLICRSETTKTELVGSGELQGALAPDIYEIASRG